MMCGFCCSNIDKGPGGREREGGIEEKGGQRIILMERRGWAAANNGGERERKERG